MNALTLLVRLASGLAMLLPYGVTVAQALPAGQVQPPSTAAAGLQKWIANAEDNRGLPYLILDKQLARIWIFDAGHLLVESSPVLLGSAVGDGSVPGIGTRPLAQIKPHERTTPAGRFLLEAGRNMAGEDIFWLDYDAAVSLHRVRPGKPTDRRLHRLATPTASDNRISYGCVNVPTNVYNRSIHSRFSARGGYAYVLPERLGLHEAFPFVQPLVRRPAAPRTQHAAQGPEWMRR